MRKLLKYKKEILFIFICCWFLFIVVHISDFRTESNLEKTVSLSVTDSYQKFTETRGELLARQNRIRSFEIRLKKEIQPEKINLFVSDQRGNIIAYRTYTPQECVKKFIVDTELYVKKNNTYKITVQVYSEEKIEAKSCKIYYNAFLKLEYIAAVLLSFFAVLIALYDIVCRKYCLKKSVQCSFLKCCLGIGFQATISFIIVEYIFQNDISYNMSYQMIAMNVVCYLAVYLCLILIVNSVKIAILFCNIFFIIWGMANQYVYLFKGQALMPIDLKSIRTAAHVAAEYDYTLTPEMRVALSIMLVLTICWVRSGDQKRCLITNKKKKICSRGVGLLAGCGTIYVLMFSSFVSDLPLKLDMWNSRASYQTNGTFLSFFGYWHLMQVEQPENYSIEEVNNIVKQVERSNNESDDITPNIVVVMNEAFADLSYYGKFETNIPYLENYESISENAIKGYALVNIIGGGTANSEFEYLTGHSLAFMSSSIPYAQHIQEDHYSMASRLSTQGYDTTAIHPLQAVNWRRNAVYSYLGFDTFLSIEDMDEKNAEHVRQYISDGYTYDLVMDILKADSEIPDFIFDITVQNHSGYTYNKKDFEEEVQVIGYDSSEVNQYLTLVKKSDEYLGELIKELQEFEEPTILVFFGDHYPRVPEEFLNWINEENVNPSLETLLKKYSVPFLIWANFDIEEENNVLTSLNYLGCKTLEIAKMKLSGYDEYLLELSKSIPAMNTVGYLDAQGEYYYLTEENQYSKVLQEYWLLEYNEMFDMKKRINSFFDVQ